MPENTPKGAQIAVVGWGLAAASAVLTLAQAGVKPVWICPQSDTIAPDRIGESLSPSALPILEALGVADILKSGGHRASNAVFSAWGSAQLMERNALTQLSGPGWVLDRARFDFDLIEWAKPLADAVSTRLTAARRDAAGWVLELAAGAPFRADFILDATGRTALIGRRESVLERADQLVCVHGFVSQAHDEVEPTRATLIEAVDDGWWYAALLPDGRQVVAWFTDPDLVAPGLTRDPTLWTGKIATSHYVRRWMEEAGFVPDTAPRLASAGTTWLSPCAGAGWAAVGDAAAAFDPLSSHGMTTALWGGRQGALAALGALNGDASALQTYADTVAGGVANFLNQRAQFYAAERRFAGAPFWARRQDTTR